MKEQTLNFTTIEHLDPKEGAGPQNRQIQSSPTGFKEARVYWTNPVDPLAYSPTDVHSEIVRGGSPALRAEKAIQARLWVAVARSDLGA